MLSGRQARESSRGCRVCGSRAKYKPIPARLVRALERQAGISLIMRRAKALFARVIDLAALERAFRRASAGKRHQAEVQAFEHHLETRLCEIRREVDAGAYRWGTYRRFLIRDPQQREIRAAPFRDRVLHHAIFAVLDPLFTRGYIADSYACLRARGTHAAARRYCEFVRARRGVGYLVQCDVQRYFASVDHRVLLELVARRVGDRRLLALVASLVEHGAETPGRGMPIGNLTSQMFANLYLDPLDHFVKEELRVRHYIRYMDDTVLLADDRAEARTRLREVERFLAERLHLRLNPRRVRLAPLACACDFLGYVHRSSVISRPHSLAPVRIRRRSVRRLWRRLPVLARQVESGLEWRRARASVASWFGLAAHADAFRLSRAIFAARDVRNIGKRLIAQRLTAASAPRRGDVRTVATPQPALRERPARIASDRA